MTIPIRPAVPVDTPTIAHTLAAAFQHDPVAAWLVPDPDARFPILRDAIALHLDGAITHPGVQVDMTAATAAVAVWHHHDHSSPPPTTVEPDESFTGPWAARFHALDALITAHRPAHAHHWLTALAAHPHYQGQRLAEQLLHRHHQRIHTTAQPVHGLVTTTHARDWLTARGYHTGTPLRLPDGPCLWPVERGHCPVPAHSRMIPPHHTLCGQR
ncbi:hypothetical protein [Micromonospora echinospora]|uniref:hypothetical protein n=1 Tax=Micromonospora echinospora TaxID=1877 RepID=UPI003A882B31